MPTFRQLCELDPAAVAAVVPGVGHGCGALSSRYTIALATVAVVVFGLML